MAPCAFAFPFALDASPPPLPFPPPRLHPPARRRLRAVQVQKHYPPIPLPPSISRSLHPPQRSGRGRPRSASKAAQGLMRWRARSMFPPRFPPPPGNARRHSRRGRKRFWGRARARWATSKMLGCLLPVLKGSYVHSPGVLHISEHAHHFLLRKTGLLCRGPGLFWGRAAHLR